MRIFEYSRDLRVLYIYLQVGYVPIYYDPETYKWEYDDEDQGTTFPISVGSKNRFREFSLFLMHLLKNRIFIYYFSIIFNKFKVNTTYAVTVRARNRFGWGQRAFMISRPLSPGKVLLRSENNITMGSFERPGTLSPHHSSSFFG